MTEILIEDEQNKEEVTKEIIDTVKRVCIYTLEYEKCNFEAEISVTFTDNDGIRALNCEHRGIDRETDVLSFPMLNFGDDDLPQSCEYECDGDLVVLGDIVISLERARQQSAEFGHSFIREIAFLTAHSMLHLLGYDHVTGEEDERIMCLKQTEILNNLKITRE